MKIYVAPPTAPSPSLVRVTDALVRYAPGSPVEDVREADLVVLHVVGRQDRMRANAERVKRAGQRYAVVQYCLRGTLRPSTEGWLPLWRGAEAVWSYLDLPALCAEDGERANFNFYHAPLGVDSKVFYPRGGERDYVVATSGRSAVTESVREAIIAARRVGRPVLHLGPELRRGPGVTCVSGLDDDALAGLYGRCRFVAGLRRTEGFELPAAEGLLCGARPVCFDRAHYRRWYEPWAIFIPEGTRNQVADHLTALFRAGAEPVSEAELAAARDRFDWALVVGGFWRHAGGG